VFSRYPEVAYRIYASLVSFVFHITFSLLERHSFAHSFCIVYHNQDCEVFSACLLILITVRDGVCVVVITVIEIDMACVLLASAMYIPVA